MTALHSVLLVSLLAADPLGPGDHTRTLTVGTLERSYIVHVPPKYDPETPTPMVLVYHGGGSNVQVMVRVWHRLLFRRAFDSDMGEGERL